MRERKYVKFRVDMYEDTKFKIIDMKPERDVIHYIWNRMVLFAGKVNLEGELFLSKNIPYTIETLAIEFNRDASQIKLALDVFIELEMLELTEAKVYRVKNFVKHQNVKAKEKETSKKENTEINNSALHINKDYGRQVENFKHTEKDKGTIENEAENVGDVNMKNLEENNKSFIMADKSGADKNNCDNLLEYSSKIIESKKRTRLNKKKKKSTLDGEVIGEIITDDGIIDDASYVIEGERVLQKGEKSVFEFSFV